MKRAKGRRGAVEFGRYEQSDEGQMMAFAREQSRRLDECGWFRLAAQGKFDEAREAAQKAGIYASFLGTRPPSG